MLALPHLPRQPEGWTRLVSLMPCCAKCTPNCTGSLVDGPQVRASEQVTPGCLKMDAPLQHSLHLCPGESYDFRCVMRTICARTVCDVQWTGSLPALAPSDHAPRWPRHRMFRAFQAAVAVRPALLNQQPLSSFQQDVHAAGGRAV